MMIWVGGSDGLQRNAFEEDDGTQTNKKKKNVLIKTRENFSLVYDLGEEAHAWATCVRSSALCQAKSLGKGRVRPIRVNLTQQIKKKDKNWKMLEKFPKNIKIMKNYILTK
ncbi:hypothetical protein Sjap_008254 [Stephania japonica]|uniref:Uncharacterized protein n=1 Tax=Stephania japonica TaxID=461633 RepID=A0AAP0JPZ4_9MAGN